MSPFIPQKFMSPSRFSYQLVLKLRRRSGVFIVNFEHISHVILTFLLLILNL